MKQLLTLTLLLSLFLSCDKSSSEVEDIELYFNTIWKDFDETYSYFELKNVDWDIIREKYERKIVNGRTSNEEFKNIIISMIKELRDYHVKLIINDDQYQYDIIPKYQRNSSENATRYLSKIIENNNNITYGEIIDSNIAYLRFKNLLDNGDYSILQRFYNDVTAKNGLILDLRDNHGGNEQIAKNFISKLTKSELVYGYYRFRNGANRQVFSEWLERKVSPNTPIEFNKSIMVLINRGVVSSGEGFAAIMKAFPKAKLIGDTTFGSTGNPKEFHLPNGWKYRISSWQAVLTDYSFIEDNGISPDILITNTEESIKQGKDLILENAIENLNNNY